MATDTAAAPRAAPEQPLDAGELATIDAWWRAANYLSVGQIYLMGNPLLREPLRPEHIKPRLLGHWGTTPGLNFVYAHLNRAIAARDQNLMYVIGPGHGGPGLVAASWLEGTYSETYPDVTQDASGMRRLFTQFSFPGRHPQPRRPRDARFDPRGRRARVRPRARLRRRVRQSGPGRRRGRRRRGGRDRAAGHQLALEQVPRPGPGRRRPADPAPERLQDREPDRAGPHPAAGAARAAARVRAHAVPGRGRRPGHDAPAVRRHPRPLPRRDRRAPAPGPRGGPHRAAALADDRAGVPEGLDGTRTGGRRAGRGHLARAPGAVRQRAGRRRAPRRPGEVAEELPARGALRRRRRPGGRRP